MPQHSGFQIPQAEYLSAEVIRDGTTTFSEPWANTQGTRGLLLTECRTPNAFLIMSTLQKGIWSLLEWGNRSTDNTTLNFQSFLKNAFCWAAREKTYLTTRFREVCYSLLTSSESSRVIWMTADLQMGLEDLMLLQELQNRIFLCLSYKLSQSISGGYQKPTHFKNWDCIEH